MRITKTELTKEETKQITEMVDKLITVDDFTISADFGKDAYALLKNKTSRRRSFKNFWELFSDLRKQYTLFKIKNLSTNFEFYSNLRKYFRFLITSKLFHELEKLDPMEALQIFLKMFQPPKEQKKQKQPKPQKQPQKGKSPSGKSKDKGGMSADKGSLPIDMSKFKQNLPEIEKMLEGGALDKEDVKKHLSKAAGMDHKEIKLENIIKLIGKISDDVKEKDLEIFRIARKKELTEVWARDEELKNSLTPDNEMNIKNYDTPKDLLKILPTEFIYDDDEFTKRLARKELLIRNYQHRRLKKQALYLLIDVSGSMGRDANIYASGVALSLVRQAIDQGATYFLRFFDGIPHQLYEITDKEGAEKMCEMLIKKPFTGGGTSINSAVKQAIQDIKASPKKFEKVEIMVITDGVDHINLNKNDLEGIKLHSTIINGDNAGLEKISDTYTKLDSDKLGL